MLGKIALEEHFTVHDLLDVSERYAGPGTWGALQRRLLDFGGERLGEMDRNGIELEILSLTTPGVQGEPNVGRAIEMARRSNDLLAESIRPYPHRYAAFAALPMQDPEAACAELTRAVEQLEFKGALVNGFSQTGDDATVLYYDDPIYEGFWATAERLNVPFYLHPRDPLLSRSREYEGHPWLTGATWAFGAETAVHALRLMASGLFDRHPRLTIILGHLGEGLPYNIWRVDHRLAQLPRGIPARRPMGDYLKSNFYLTTSGNFRTPTLVDALAEIGSDRILFSVDYPFEDTGAAAQWFDAAEISEVDRLQIGRTNAMKLFGLGDPEGSAGTQSPEQRAATRTVYRI